MLAHGRLPQKNVTDATDDVLEINFYCKNLIFNMSGKSLSFVKKKKKNAQKYW